MGLVQDTVLTTGQRGGESRAHVTEKGKLENRVGPTRAWGPGGAAAKRQVRPKQEGEDQDQSLLRAEKERKRTVSAAAVTAFYTQSLPGQRPDHPALQPQRASPGLRSGPAASRALCGPHLHSCLLLCRKVWIWARSCSPSATCPQQAGSPSP